jgi:hypothetical protein
VGETPLITIGQSQIDSLDQAFGAIEQVVKDHYGVNDLSQLSFDEKKSAIALMMSLGVTALRNCPRRLQKSFGVSRTWVYDSIKEIENC